MGPTHNSIIDYYNNINNIKNQMFINKEISSFELALDKLKITELEFLSINIIELEKLYSNINIDAINILIYYKKKFNEIQLKKKYNEINEITKNYNFTPEMVFW